MTQNIILCDDHALLWNGIKNWIETHSKYKVRHEIGTWAECKRLADCIAPTIAPINNPGAAQSGYIAIVDILIALSKN